MIKLDIPTRARRALGAGVLAVASVVVGYAAWAAEPALTPPQSGAEPVEQAPGAVGTVQFTLRRAPGEEGPLLHSVRKGMARLSGNVPLQMSATTVTPGPNGQQTLEGGVRIVIPRPAGTPGKAILVRKTPDGEVVTKGAAPKTVTLTAEKVILTPLEDGGVQLEWENGEMEPSL